MVEDELDEVEEEEEEETKKEVKIDKATKYAIDKIKEHLELIASKDELFAKKYRESKKTLIDCWKYICSEAQKNSNQCLHSDSLMQMAYEFYQDDLKADKAALIPTGKVLAENYEEDAELKEYSKLSEKEKQEIHEKALKEFDRAEKEKLYAQKKKEEEKISKKKKKQENEGFISLF